MRIGQLCGFAVRGLSRLALAATLVQSANAATQEEKFNLFQTKTKAYTNVTVTSKTKSYVLIMHASGMGSVPLADLTPELMAKLGYGAETSKETKTNSLSASLSRLASGLHLTQVKVFARTWSKHLPAVASRLHLSDSDLYTVLAILFGVYLVACYCLAVICRKAHSDPGFLVWVPLFQVFPMLRAAKMSRWWFLVLWTPVVNLLGMTAWSFQIVRVREKSPWVAVLLVLPVTTLFAFLYLTFSSSKPLLEAPRYKSMALQTA